MTMFFLSETCARDSSVTSGCNITDDPAAIAAGEAGLLPARLLCTLQVVWLSFWAAFMLRATLCYQTFNNCVLCHHCAVQVAEEPAGGLNAHKDGSRLGLCFLGRSVAAPDRAFCCDSCVCSSLR